MSRFYGSDVITRLQKIGSDNLNNMLQTIMTERSYTGIELVSKFNIGICERQYPECVVNLKDSELDVDELNLDIEQTPEVFPAEIIIIMRDNTADIALRMEYYIEAMQRIFHGYKDVDISWISVKNSIRANGYTEQKETLKIIGIEVEVRIF